MKNNVWMWLTAAALALGGTAVMAEGSLSVTKEATINANADDLWGLVGDFGGLHNWHPAVANTAVSGDSTQSGAMRILTLGDGAQIHETLESRDNAGKSTTYIITESPLPVRNYRSTISVRPAAGGQAVFRWTSTFDAKDVPDEEAVNAITGVYQGGIDGLMERYK